MTLATRSTEGSGATVRVMYPGYRGPPVTAQKYKCDQFPPLANGWGTKYPVSDMVPPHLAVEEGPPTKDN
jgi:hypothetical protein